MSLIQTRATAGVSNEQWDYTDPLGTKFSLTSFPRKVVLSEEGTGMPELNYVTQRGPFQHGVTMRSFFLGPRLMRLVVRHSARDRNGFWDMRAALLDGIRPNKGLSSVSATTGVLRKRLYDGTYRSIKANINAGPVFDARDPNQWDEAGFTETLQFIAFDPVWYDPAIQSISSTLVAVATFPMTFPVAFFTYSGSGTILYAGTWQEYPTIVITGPLKNPLIWNTTTDERIALNYTVQDGFSVTIALSYDTKSVTLSDGTNLIGYIAPNSDLATFHLEPGGNNLIALQGDNGSAATSVAITYYNRYIGI